MALRNSIEAGRDGTEGILSSLSRAGRGFATLARENGEDRGRAPARSGEEAEGVAVGLCQADEALPHLAGHAGVIAELGDNLRRRGGVIVSTIAAHLK